MTVAIAPAARQPDNHVKNTMTEQAALAGGLFMSASSDGPGLREAGPFFPGLQKRGQPGPTASPMAFGVAEIQIGQRDGQGQRSLCQRRGECANGRFQLIKRPHDPALAPTNPVRRLDPFIANHFDAAGHGQIKEPVAQRFQTSIVPVTGPGVSHLLAQIIGNHSALGQRLTIIENEAGNPAKRIGLQQFGVIIKGMGLNLLHPVSQPQLTRHDATFAGIG